MQCSVSTETPEMPEHLSKGTKIRESSGSSHTQIGARGIPSRLRSGRARLYVLAWMTLVASIKKQSLWANNLVIWHQYHHQRTDLWEFPGQPTYIETLHNYISKRW